MLTATALCALGVIGLLVYVWWPVRLLDAVTWLGVTILGGLLLWWVAGRVMP